MNNILEAISTLSSNNKLKENLIKEFDEQINKIEDLEEKWNNYGSFIGNEETLDLFLERFSIDFILEHIIGYFKSSSLNTDNIHNNLFQNIDLILYKKSLKGFNDNQKEKIKSFLNLYGTLLQNSFYNSYYNNSILYNNLKENTLLSNIIFYLILGYIKDLDFEDIKNVRSDFNILFGNSNNQSEKRIYQFLAFSQNNEDFNKHLIIISFLVLFLEDNDLGLTNFRLLNTSYTTTLYIKNLFEKIKNLETDSFTDYLKQIKDFRLIYNFLRNLEEKTWIDIEYRKKILNILLDEILLENNELIDFSILLSKNIGEKYNKFIKKKEFKESKILEKLDGTNIIVKETINFLLITEKYIKGDVLTKLVDFIKSKIKETIIIDDLYFKLYENIINGKYGEIKLDFKLNDFYNNETEENKLINGIIGDIDGFKFTLENIEKFLIKEDLNDFYYLFLKEYIEKNNSSGEVFSKKDIRDKFKFKDSDIKKSLDRLKTEGVLKGASGFGRYEVI